MHTITQLFRNTIQLPIGTLLPSSSPIQGIVLNGMYDNGLLSRIVTNYMLSGNASVRALAGYLNKHGFIVKPICSPTVPKGQERVRICLHGHNTVNQVESLVNAVHEFFKIEKVAIESSTPVSTILEPAKL